MNHVTFDKKGTVKYLIWTFLIAWIMQVAVAVLYRSGLVAFGQLLMMVIGLLYGIAFTIKMSYKGDHKIDGYFEYVVPPLEGFWWQDGVHGIDYSRKEDFNFISVIRLPDFVTKADFDWAVAKATQKKKTDFSQAEFFSYEEGECVQCMHIGSYDNESATIAMMHDLKTVVRHPIRRKSRRDCGINYKNMPQ